jgi:hypothetical protein
VPVLTNGACTRHEIDLPSERDYNEQWGIPYAVVGSLASSLHGVMRSTLDVDIVSDMREEHIPPLVAAPSKEFYADEEMMNERGASTKTVRQAFQSARIVWRGGLEPDRGGQRRQKGRPYG